jgi:isocitrate dehydrogenase
MPNTPPKIIYTVTDEAPYLATAAFLPVVRKFASAAGVQVDKADISVAARILAEFPDHLKEDQRVPKTLTELGKLCLLPDTNIIKLPNISASVAQLIAAIKELQAHGLCKSPTTPKAPRPTKKRRSARATVVVSAVRSTPCCEKATQTAVHPRP